MLIAEDTCSNENNISVYVEQIFQKLKLYQNSKALVKLLIKSSDSSLKYGWLVVEKCLVSMKPLVKSIQI